MYMVYMVRFKGLRYFRQLPRGGWMMTRDSIGGMRHASFAVSYLSDFVVAISGYQHVHMYVLCIIVNELETE